MEQKDNTPAQPAFQPDKSMLINYLYWFVVLGITIYVSFAEVWPYSKILDWNLDENNEYYPKLVFMETLLSIALPAMVPYYIIKRLMKSKERAS